MELKKHKHHKISSLRLRKADPPAAEGKKEGKEGEPEEPADEKNATTVEQMIRHKGTFIIAYVDVKQNLADVYNNTMFELKKEKEAEEKKDADEQKAKIDKVKAASAPKDGKKDAKADAPKKKLHKRKLHSRADSDEEKPAFGGLSSDEMILDETSTNNLFDNISVEFPSYCRPLWSKGVELNVAKKAAEMLPCWKKAAAAENATFLELPYLNAT